MALHLVRHGESEWNLLGRAQGQSMQAGSLTALGRTQAKRTGETLAWRNLGAERIVSSDLPRARETAAIIASVVDLPIEADPDLREIRLGELEGRRFADPMGTGTVQDVIDGLWRDPLRRAHGAETVAELYTRIREAIARYSGRELILVTHGGPMRVSTTHHDPRRGTAIPRILVANTAVVSLP